jgi:hypothetical protein
VFLCTAATLAAIFCSSVSAQEPQVKAGWLNGKWEGEGPAGRVTMTFKVVQDNEFTGQAVVKGHPRCRITGPIAGTVKGKIVDIHAQYTQSCEDTTISYSSKYRLKYEEGKLTGKSGLIQI